MNIFLSLSTQLKTVPLTFVVIYPFIGFFLTFEYVL